MPPNSRHGACQFHLQNKAFWPLASAKPRSRNIKQATHCAGQFQEKKKMAARSNKKQKESDETMERALAAPLSAAELQVRINARAHEVFLARNGGPGDELSDWLTAEREVCGSLLAMTSAADETDPVPTTAPKRKRATTTAKPAVVGSPTKPATRSSSKTSGKSSTKPSKKPSTKSSGKSSGQPPSPAPRSRKRKTNE